ncbi:hypothetical protein D3C84_1116320 [compost metagenome]
MDVDGATGRNADVTATAGQGDAILGSELQVALHGLCGDVLLGNEVEDVAVGFDLQRAFA